MARERAGTIYVLRLSLLLVVGLFSRDECAAQITLDGSLGPQQALAGPNFMIDSTFGQIRGANLFHSFGRFNVQTGQSATFTNSLPNAIANILSRVTGGERSFIDGALRSTIAGANLYLLNPSGVMFGPNAVLDLSGSFHVSTADYLRLADGGMFYANLQNASNLTIAPPAAFGFMSQSPASISFDRSLLEVPQGQTLSVIGGDVQIIDTVLRARSGLIQIASAASSGEVIPNVVNAMPELGVGSLARLGRIELLDGANATTSGPAGSGTVLIRGGRLLLDNGAFNANSTGDANGAPLGIDVRITDDAVLTNGGQIVHAGFAAGGAGEARIQAGKLVVTNDGFINGAAGDAADGRGITINAGTLEVSNGGSIGAQTLGPRAGGNIDITAGKLTIAGGDSPGFTGIFTAQFNSFGTGKAGNLIVNADYVSLTGSSQPHDLTGIVVQTAGPAAAGALQISAKSVDITDKSVLSNTTFGSGPGGVLTLNVDGNLAITGSTNPSLSTGIFSNTFSSGRGGKVDITTRGLFLNQGAGIGAGTQWSGDAGSVAVKASGDISITGSTNPNIFTGIFANTFGTGKGGQIDVSSRNLRMAQRGSIQAGTFSPGDAGEASVRTGLLEISGGSSIFTSSVSGSGNAGNLVVTADTIVITGVRNSIDPIASLTDFTGLSTTTGVNGKRGGDLTVVADRIVVTDKGAILSQSLGAGDAGNLQINANSLWVTEKAAISSNAFGSGRGGNIEIRANDVTVSGAGAPLGPMDSLISGIGAQAGGNGGAAGDMTIVTGILQVLDGAKVTTQTFGPGKGGNLNIEANNILISGINAALENHLRSIGEEPTGARAAIAASSERFLIGDAATGNAGNLRIVAGDLQVNAGGALTSRTNTPGAGGRLEVLADQVTLAADALITAESSTSANAGKAGDISLTTRNRLYVSASRIATAADRAAGGAIGISANLIQFEPGTVVTARSAGAGNAGSIAVIAGHTLVSRNSVISTEANQADGGNITLKAPTMVHLVDTKVTTAVGMGQGSGGNIIIDPLFVLLDGAEIRADAFGGPGGNINILADVFLTQDSTLSASSALSTPGSIDIQARVTDISGHVARLPASAPPVAALLRASCAARLAGGSISTLVVAGREGLPPDPEGPLPSPLLTDRTASQTAVINPLEPARENRPRFSLAAVDPLCSGFRVR